MGMFSRETQEEYWSSSYDVQMATASGVVRAEFEDTPKGVKVSGAWDFASGIDYADWIQLNRPVPSNQGAEQLLIPKKDFKILDNWHTAGARASGSKRVVIEEAFVPPHHILDAALMASGHTPGRALHPSRYYKLPIFPWMSYVIGVSIMGAAQGMIDLFAELAPRRREMTTGERFVERPANQIRVAEAAAEIHAARQILAGDIQLFHQWADADHEPTLLERATVRRNTGYCVKLSLQAAYRLFEVGGAHAIYNENPMQRFYRDISTMSHSIAVVWDPIWEQYGRLLWGLPQSSYIL
jgi:alkylation response protein AidB-like acyl-CoA dehydrogenase